MNNRININAVTEKADSLDRSSNTSVDRVLGNDALFKYLFEDATLNDLMNITRVSKRWHALATLMVRSLLASYPLRRREIRDNITTDRQTMDRDIYASLIRSAAKTYMTFIYSFSATPPSIIYSEDQDGLEELYVENIELLSNLPGNLFLLNMMYCFEWIGEHLGHRHQPGLGIDVKKVQLRIPSMLPREKVELLIDEGIYKVFLTSEFLDYIMDQYDHDQVKDYCDHLFSDRRLSLIPRGFDGFDKENQKNFIRLLFDLIIKYYKRQDVSVVLEHIGLGVEDRVLSKKLKDLFKLAQFDLSDVMQMLRQLSGVVLGGRSKAFQKRAIVLMSFISLLMRETLNKSNDANLLLDENTRELVLRDFDLLVIFLKCSNLNESHWTFDAYDVNELIQEFYQRNGIHADNFSSLMDKWHPFAINYFENELTRCLKVLQNVGLELYEMLNDEQPATLTGLYGLFSAETTITTEAESETTETESDDQEPLFKYMRHE